MYEATREPPVTNSVCSRERELSGLRKENSELSINRLPPEILSHILLIGVEFDRKVWRWESQNAQSQHIASHVCRHWREVAISTPSLWTFIHITGPPSKYITLCINRSADAFLDILINMFPLIPYPNYPYDPIRGTQPTSDILQFLTKSGAGAHRWRSLFVRFPESDLLPIFVGYLNANSPTCLRLLRFECANWMFRDMDNGASFFENKPEKRQAHDQSRTLLASSLPNLHELELVSISATYVYTSKPLVALPTLHTLSITPSSPYSVDLANILLSNPQLESLYLQGSNYHGGETRMNPPDRDLIWPVVLPALRSLHLSAVDNARWVVDMLSTIKAPKLHHLAIQSFNQFTFGSEQRERIISFIATGREAPDHSGDSKLPCTPAYPSIQSFNVFNFPCSKTEFMRLMGSLSQLTHLTARSKQAEWLGAAPWILPKLEALEVPQLTAEAAVKLLRSRSEGETPLKELRTQGGCLRLAAPRTKSYDAIKGSPRAIPGYEYQQFNRGMGAPGDWESILKRSGDFKKEHQDRLEYDLEEDRYDSLFDED